MGGWECEKKGKDWKMLALKSKGEEKRGGKKKDDERRKRRPLRLGGLKNGENFQR